LLGCGGARATAWRQKSRLVWRECTAGEVAAHFCNPPEHFATVKLRAGWDERRDGTRRLYRARPQRLAEVQAFVASFWDESLAQIKSSAETDARRRS
jgi:hypothetical protein